MLANKEVLSALKNALKIGMVAENPQAIPILESIQPVVPVLDYQLTGEIVMDSATMDLYTGTANYELVPAYTCPGGKRAYVYSCYIEDTVAHTAIAAGTPNSLTEYGTLSLAGTAEKLVEPRGGLWLEAGQCIGAYSESRAGGDTSILFNYIVVEVDW